MSAAAGADWDAKDVWDPEAPAPQLVNIPYDFYIDATPVRARLFAGFLQDHPELELARQYWASHDLLDVRCLMLPVFVVVVVEVVLVTHAHIAGAAANGPVV